MGEHVICRQVWVGCIMNFYDRIADNQIRRLGALVSIVKNVVWTKGEKL